MIADSNTDFETENPVLVTQENFKRYQKHMPFVARKVLQLLFRIELGSLTVKLPSGEVIRFDSGNPGPAGDISLANWNLPRKVAFGGTIGVAESYIEEDWTSRNVSQTLEFFLVNRSIYDDIASQSKIVNLIESVRHWFNKNTRSGSKKNISAHYDLGNEFYSLWLDPSMTYSSGIYADGANSLERAQHDKYASLAKHMGITRNSHVLEIGCGWGGFAEYVGKEIGAKLTGLTISREQLAYGQKRIRDAGLEDRIELKFQDYREETGKYDHIASIEMFEAVGEEYWPTYFNTIKQCLKPGGTAGLQIITIRNENFETYRRRPDFIQRYVFPGGMLPSPDALDRVTGKTGLTLHEERVFPQDYALTLIEWRRRFHARWDEIKSLGFDERFRRLWEFYLYYCEAGFRSEGIDVRQMFYRHP
ncbi:MAG: cyclopropane-fatty-acyl-phospholipid synthase family protein [Pseudomonadota bacterium]